MSPESALPTAHNANFVPNSFTGWKIASGISCAVVVICWPTSDILWSSDLPRCFLGPASENAVREMFELNAAVEA